MLRPTIFCFVLACVVSLCTSNDEISEDSATLLWAQTFGQLSEMPMKGDTVNPNPWEYTHRMSMYRIMITSTDPSMAFMGTGTTENPMWGLPLQLAWMLNSGRLADPTGTTTCGVEEKMCISPQSLFGCFNYFTSVLPFLSAAHNSIMQGGTKVEMQNPSSLDEYCTTHTDCSTKYSDVMAAWDAFFQGVKNKPDPPESDSVRKDTLLGLYWTAQLASFSASTSCSTTRNSSYSSVELAFTRGWMKSVEFVAAASFHSNYLNSAPMISSLPSRVLQDNDIHPIDGFTAEQNHALQSFAWMRNYDDKLNGGLVTMWKAAMCSVSTREQGRQLLRDLTLKPGFPIESAFGLLTTMPFSCIN